MNLIEMLMNPFILIFASAFFGLLLGKITLGRFKLGVSGALFSGLILGKIAYERAIGISETASGYAAAQNLISSGVAGKDFFQLFLIFFVASVGLLASKDMGVVLRKYGLKFIALGIIITFTGAIASYGVMNLGFIEDKYEMMGIYTGSLTSSPGFAAAVETAGNMSAESAENYESMSFDEKAIILEILDPSGSLTPDNTPYLSENQKSEFVRMTESNVGVGNAIAYPFGVLIVILAMNILPLIFNIEMEKERGLYDREMKKARGKEENEKAYGKIFDLPAFVFVCLLGYAFGKCGLPLGNLGILTLGSTGGVLIVALVLGHIGRIGPFVFRMDSSFLSVLRQISLAFFLSIVGLRNGYAVFAALNESGPGLAISALIVGSASMAVGFIIGRYVFKINWIMLSGAICGGMTSTPGLGAAIDAVGSDDPAAGYGATYPFALMGMVVFTLMINAFTY